MAVKKKNKILRIDSFDFYPGRVLAGKYEVMMQLGGGWEGEVYLIREMATGIERTAKFFFPQRNVRDKAVKYYAKKLHKLRHCPIVIQYITQDKITHSRAPISFLISEFVEGELLSKFLDRQPGKRIMPFQAIHLLHALSSGMESIHRIHEYHGDLHTDNIILQRYGLGFDMKLIDMFQWSAPRSENIRDDVLNMIRVFYDALGGQKHYAKQPEEVKAICCGLKSSLIFKKFRTARHIREYIETMEWH